MRGRGQDGQDEQAVVRGQPLAGDGGLNRVTPVQKIRGTDGSDWTMYFGGSGTG